MIYTLCLSPFGEVSLHLDTIHISGRNIHISGYDYNHSRIDFIMDRLSYLDDYFADYGYCHIISYTQHGITTPCNIFRALS